jgi:hypothetical protein
MINPVAGVAIAAAMAVAPVKSAAAEARSTFECPLCRAMAHFRTCDKPMAGKVVFQGRAIKTERSDCSHRLSLEVPRATTLGLPSSIQVDLGPCAIWAGDTNAMIEMAVEEPPSLERSVYTLACRLW